MSENDKEYPSIDIRIDKDGVWYYKGNEMFRKDIIELFYNNLERDSSGRYLIRKDHEAFFIEVEDTPYAVKSIEYSEKEGVGSIELLLSDSSTEELNPSTLWIGKGNVLYCSVKNNFFEARFTRQSYYQLAEYIRHDSEKDRFYLILNDCTYEISSK